MKPSAIRAALKSCPLFLPDDDPTVQKIAKKLWQSDVGIEIETNPNTKFTKLVSGLPIVKVNCSNDEIRVRLPNGLQGFKLLYALSLILKKTCKLNPKSGIHYHIERLVLRDKLSFEHINGKKILSQLDKWNYTGTYNNRAIFTGKSCYWVNIRDTPTTIEYRIGEQTFDYELLLKRILHCQSLTRYLELLACEEKPNDISPKLNVVRFNKRRTMFHTS